MTILVLDVGSSSVRALLYDDQVKLLAHAARTHHAETTPPGASTFDMTTLAERAEACLDEILQHEQARDIRAVGMDTFVGNVLGVNAAGRVMTPVFTYADTRSADDVAALAERIDRKAAHQRTGCIHHTAYLPGRLHWLRRTDPELYQSVAQWLDVGTYLYRRWFGESAGSYSVASWSGLLNRETLGWDAEWLDRLSVDESELPTLAEYDAACSGLLPDYAERWAALRDVPFYLAVGDGAAANVGSGCVGGGQMALSLGTTAALRVVSTEALPPVPPGLWSYRISAGEHLIGGATSEGGNIFEWARATLTLPDDAEAQLAGRAPDGHGLTFLPLLAGERSPGWWAGATGAVSGLRLSTTPVDILQAALEGVALRLAMIADQLHDSAVSVQQPVTANGRALEASPAWAQMFTDALNRPLRIAGESEITARGTALLVLRALDGRDVSEFPLTIAATVEPRLDGVEALRAARERQEALYRQFYG
ncbi:MAG: gluconokinase [Anaerolineae bacterium]|nr:gluconokinase [Anaerolineae bacterium]